jgi:threonine/homoserine/homoserine lactone efflux protein
VPALTGFLLGFAVAATPGPIFFLCLRRTLASGWRAGVVSGLGVATADAVYATLAAFGVVAVSAALLGQQRWLTLVGGLALIGLGIRNLLARRSGGASEQRVPDPQLSRGRELGTYLSMLGLTLANPATILSFAAIFTSLGLRPGGGLRPAALVAGVLAGSAAWWLLLACGVALVRRRLSLSVVRWISAASAGALLAFGTAAVYRAL